jgi:hypothetical protein
MATGFITRNSAQVGKDSVVVYVCSPKGEIELSPDGRLTQKQLDKIGYKGWHRCEATGVKEIEALSLKISRQLFEKKKAMKVQQHLREKFFIDQLKVRCKLRKAQGFSKNDSEMNDKILQRAEHTENTLYAIIAEEFNPGTRNTALELEVRERSTSALANVGNKREGILA